MPPASTHPQNSCRSFVFSYSRSVVPQPLPPHTPVIWNWNPNQKWMVPKPFGMKQVWQWQCRWQPYLRRPIMSHTCTPHSFAVFGRTFPAGPVPVAFLRGHGLPLASTEERSLRRSWQKNWPSGDAQWPREKQEKFHCWAVAELAECRTAWKPWTRQICGLGMVGGKASSLTMQAFTSVFVGPCWTGGRVASWLRHDQQSAGDGPSLGLQWRKATAQ